MSAPDHIQLGDGTTIPILYEDRSVLAVDKPAGWMLVPYSWQRTARNLQAAIVSSIAARQFWARARNLKFLRHVHRLDAETSGVLLFAKSPGAVESYGRLFESRRMDKRYLLVVQGIPQKREWTCYLKLGPDAKQIGRMRVDGRNGKQAETHFQVLQTSGATALVEAWPWTGRTHQIRVHAVATGHAIVGDPLYGPASPASPRPAPSSVALSMGLRAVSLSFRDPFTGRPVRIQAPFEEFLRTHGFDPGKARRTEPQQEARERRRISANAHEAGGSGMGD